MKKSNLSKIALFAMVVIALASIYFAYTHKGNNFWLTIAGGIAAGALMAAAQYLVSMAEYKELDKAYKELHGREKEIEIFKKMGVKKILPARDNPDTYGRIIDNAKDKIWVMRNTASRLLEDFAHKDGGNWYRSALLDFLKRGGNVKILIAEKKYLFKVKDKKKYDIAKLELENLANSYQGFRFTYFKHIPTHSMFIFDNSCLLGPIFDNLDSKSTPVLEMDTNSEFAIKYINYFNHQWAEAIDKDVKN